MHLWTAHQLEQEERGDFSKYVQQLFFFVFKSKISQTQYVSLEQAT